MPRVVKGEEGKRGKRVSHSREKSSPVDGQMTSGRKRSRSSTYLKTADAKEKMKVREKGDSNIDELRTLFDQWTVKYKKEYRSKKERKRRFKIFCDSKESMDEANKIEDVFRLNHLADVELNELCGIGERNRYPSIHESDISSTDEDSDDLKEEKIEFEMWAKQHGRKYSSEAERTSRFGIFLNHKRLIDGFVKANGCSCSTGGYDVDDMDMNCWEAHT